MYICIIDITFLRSRHSWILQNIQKDIRPMLSMMVVAFVVVRGASILYTIFITDRMVRPLKYLTSMADRILSGLNEEEVKKCQFNLRMKSEHWHVR